MFNLNYLKYILIVLSFLNNFHSKAQNGVEVIAYVTSSNLSSSYDKMDFCAISTLNLSFMNPDAQGNLSFPQNLTDEINYAKNKNPNIKIFAALAGGTQSRDPIVNGYYRNLLSNTNRAGFIQKLVDYVLDNNLDGIDVDLEGNGLFEGYNEFSIELAAALKAKGKGVSVALPWYLPNFVTQQALLAYDYINVMAYDDGGSWKPTPKQHSSMAHLDDCIDFWVNKKGIKKENLALGVPFYGYTWNVSPATAYTYRDAANDGYADVDQFGNAFHNGRPTMRTKVAQIYNQGFKGVMIWQIGQDHWGEFSLLKTIDEKIKDLGSFTINGCDDDGNNTHIPEDDPIAFFPFETDILDYSTAGKDFDNGSNAGGVIIDDPVRGSVMEFKGSDLITIQDGVETPDGLPSRNEITVSTWVKSNSAHEWGGFVGAFQDNGSEESGWILGSRNQKFSIGVTGSDQTINYLTDNTDFDLNKWYHVVATYNGTSIKLFVNGNEKASTTETGNIYYLNSGWFQIGSYKDNDEDNGHDGLLDNVTIWERALTTQEISDLYIKELLTSSNTINFYSEINIYPNPSIDKFTISTEEKIVSWTIYNTIGKKIKSGKNTLVSTEKFSAGTYFINVQLEKGNTVKKITIR